MANLLDLLMNKKRQELDYEVKPLNELSAPQMREDGSVYQLANPVDRPVTISDRINNLQNRMGNALFGRRALPTDAVGNLVTNPDGTTQAVTTVSENPRIGGFFNDLSQGYRENRTTPISLDNFGQNKGFATRLGEGLGSIARFADSPAGRALIMGGIVGATGGGALPALAFGTMAGVGNQQNRMRDALYRNQLKNLGMPVDEINSINGYISDSAYKNISDTYRARWNKTNWGELANFNPVIAEAVKNNPNLANSFVPASVANTILKGDLTDAQIANLMARTRETESRIGVAKQNADANTKRANAYSKFMTDRTNSNEAENADLAEFLNILNTNDNGKIEYARNSYIKRYGKDPYKLIKM